MQSLPIWFQFLIGSLKTWIEGMEEIQRKNMFQFLIGSLKTDIYLKRRLSAVIVSIPYR